MKTTYFDIKRIGLLLRRQAVLQSHIMVIAAGAIIGLLLMVYLLITYTTPYLDKEVFLGLFLPFFYFVGFLFSSRVFHELDTPEKGYVYLTLPAATVEKWFSGWVISAVFYIIFSWIVVILLNLFVLTVGDLLFDNTVVRISLFDETLWNNFRIYLILQSIFLFGASYFRRHNFLKTLLSLILFGFFISFFSGILGYLIFGTFDFSTIEPGSDVSAHLNFEETIPVLSRFCFNYVLAPVFLFISYISLRERQI